MSFRDLRCATLIARKKHKCIWCGELIEVGQPAVYRCYIFDGDFMYDRLHPECFVAMTHDTHVMEDGEFLPFQNERGKNSAGKSFV